MSQLKGAPLEKKQIFEKKSHNAEKLKRGPFGIFKHPICCKISKKLKEGPFGEKKKLEKKVSQCRKTKRGDPLRFFNIHFVAKHEKMKKKFYFREKISQCRKKLKGGPFGIFQHPFCRKTSKKCRGTLSGKNFRKKMSRSAEKNERGDSLVSPGMVCYMEKQGSHFWSSSLGQMVQQLDTIIFFRTFRNYFGQFVWIEKKGHYNSRVSLHEAPTNNTSSLK